MLLNLQLLQMHACRAGCYIGMHDSSRWTLSMTEPINLNTGLQLSVHFLGRVALICTRSNLRDCPLARETSFQTVDSCCIRRLEKPAGRLKFKSVLRRGWQLLRQSVPEPHWCKVAPCPELRYAASSGIAVHVSVNVTLVAV